MTFFSGYPFAATIAKARQDGYAKLTVPEKWEWHADVYGFRRAFLGVWDKISPCDGKGEWYDGPRAAIAEDFYRARFGGGVPVPGGE